MNQHLRRKLTLRAHEEQVVFVKHAQERIEHVWMKAFLWALYLPDYPDLSVEVSVEDKYKPDVVQRAPMRRTPMRKTMVFWGEAGVVGNDKVEDLIRRYPDTHFAFMQWNRSLNPLREQVEAAVHSVSRQAPIDLIRAPEDAADRFVDDRGRVSLTFDDVHWTRVHNAESLR